jgi:tetratricopeptide (TPR) repeat protein
MLNCLFSLEFVEGGSLDKKLKGTPLPTRPGAELVETLARAMHAAHQRGIVHRDLKPANILLAPAHGGGAAATAPDAPASPAGMNWVPKIADFGLAKRLDVQAGQTQSGAIMGTPSYMAPEQARGESKEISPAADVYALGAILYEVLTGRPPFKGATAWDTVVQVISTEPVPPSRIQPGVPRDLDTICLKCLQKNKAKRYATAEALAEDLRRFLNGEPIHARPTPAWERLGKWARRKPAQAALITVALVAVLAVVAISVPAALYYKQELKKAEDRESLRGRSGRGLLRAQEHMAAGRWSAALTELEQIQGAFEAQPDLRADDLRDQVRRRLAVVRRRLREQEQRQQARKRLQAFQGPHNDALVYATHFTSQDLAESRSRTRTAARTALAVYGLDRGDGSVERGLRLLDQDRPHLGAAEHARLVSACYELLRIWAEAEGPGRQRAALLARAARLAETGGRKMQVNHLRFLEGMGHYLAGAFEPARKACAEVLDRQGDHFWARYVLALCQLRTGRWLEGKAELTVCINRRPEFVWPRLVRGFAASELGFMQADARLAAAEFNAAEKDLDAALRQDRDPLVQYVGLANRGVLHIRRRRWAEAVADLRRAVRLKPEGYQAHANLAQALQGMGRWAEAVATLDQAIRRAPLAVLYQSRARLQLRRKHWLAARTDFEQAIAREPRGSKSPQLVENLVELGRLLHREGKYPAALASYDRALRLKSEFGLAQRFRAETLLALNRPNEAGQALDRYLDVTRDVPAEVYQARALIYAGVEQLPAAIEMYTLALRQHPQDTVTRCYRGWTYLLTDAVQLALEDFEACLRADPNNADARIGRGNARVRLRQLDGALADAQAAEQQDPRTYRLLYNLTRIYAQVAGQLEVEAQTARPGPARRAAQRLTHYQAKALDCLRRALKTLPPERRADSWRNQVQADPALKAIRRGSQYFKLAARYRGTRS